MHSVSWAQSLSEKSQGSTKMQEESSTARLPVLSPLGSNEEGGRGRSWPLGGADLSLGCLVMFPILVWYILCLYICVCVHGGRGVLERCITQACYTALSFSALPSQAQRIIGGLAKQSEGMDPHFQEALYNLTSGSSLVAMSNTKYSVTKKPPGRPCSLTLCNPGNRSSREAASRPRPLQRAGGCPEFTPTAEPALPRDHAHCGELKAAQRTGAWPHYLIS